MSELTSRVILHRPYLRFDPAAYPESQEIVVNAATIILTAYETAFQTKASVFWVWWSIPYRVSSSFSLLPRNSEVTKLISRHSTPGLFAPLSLFVNLVQSGGESAW